MMQHAPSSPSTIRGPTVSILFSEEQSLLRDAVSRFLRDRYTPPLRWQGAGSAEGWNPAIWQAFGDLGLLSLAEADMAGDAEAARQAAIVLEEMGRALVVEPFTDCVILAGNLLRALGGPLATALLEGVAGGTVRPVLAWDGSDHLAGAAALSSVTAVPVAGGWLLSGSKRVVAAAPVATHLLLPARSVVDGEALLFAVTPGTAGLTLHKGRTIDSRTFADIELADVGVSNAALLGRGVGVEVGVETALELATAALCAEAVGSMRELVEQTAAYAKQRAQFGQPIARFQAIQHRIVDMHLYLQQAAAAVHLAFTGLSGAPDGRARAISAAKATIGQAGRFIGQNAVQLHGAMGLMDELPVSHHFKRLTAIGNELGTADRHLRRYAALSRQAAA